MSNHVQCGTNADTTANTTTSLRSATDAQPGEAADQNQRGSVTNPIPFVGRSRAETKAFRLTLAGEAVPEALTGAGTPRRARTARRPSPIGVIVPGLRLPKELSGYRPQDAGILTHAILAIVAPSLGKVRPEDLSDQVFDVAGALVNGANINRRRVLQMTASAHACRYLRHYAPTAPWELISAEFQTGGGRTDLAWRNAVTGQVFFDEIKTHNRPIAEIAPDTVAQATAQAEGGLSTFGQQFAGVRVVPFGALHLLTLFPAAGPPRQITPTRENPIPTH